MKKNFFAIFLCSIVAHAWIPGICDISDARKDSFGKAEDYYVMKECIEGDRKVLSLRDYQNKVYWCACYTGAMACYFGKDINKMKFASNRELQEADKKATKLAKQCYDKMKN